MRRALTPLLALLLAIAWLHAQDGEGLPEGFKYSATRSADGFDMPVG